MNSSGAGLLWLILDAVGALRDSGEILQTTESVKIDLGSLRPTATAILPHPEPLNYTLIVASKNGGRARYAFKTVFASSANQTTKRSVVVTPVLEDTGVNRMLGGANTDHLYGGTGLDFMFGNGSASEPDVLWTNRGTRFEDQNISPDEATNQAWKSYARQTNEVWYLGGSNLDDVISVDFVTEPGLLSGHHLVTRLTNNNGNFTFDAQIRLDANATDAQGNPIWASGGGRLDLNTLIQTDKEQRRDQLVNGLEARSVSDFFTLPGEGDFQAIIIDALAGNDRITVGPTVQKSVWIDAGAGDDQVQILSGNAILIDSADQHPATVDVTVRNDTRERAFNLGLKGPGPQATIDLGLGTFDASTDVDWYRLRFARPGVHGDYLLITSVNAMSLSAEIFAPGSSVPIRSAHPRQANLPSGSLPQTLEFNLDGLPDRDGNGSIAYSVRIRSEVATVYRLDLLMVPSETTTTSGGLGAVVNQNAAWLPALPAFPAQILPDAGESVSIPMFVTARNDMFETAFDLTVPGGGSINRSIRYEGLTLDNPNDQDWFAFRLDHNALAGEKLVVSSLSSDDGLQVSLFSLESNALKPIQATSRGALTFDLGAAGLHRDTKYYLKLTADNKVTIYSLAFVLGTGGDLAEGESASSGNNESARAYDLGSASAATVFDNLTIDDPADVDWFRFDVPVVNEITGSVALPRSGQLSGDATFSISLKTGSEVAVRVEAKDTNSNASALDLLYDIQRAIEKVGLKDGVAAALDDLGRLKLTGIQGGAGSRFKLMIDRSVTANPAVTELHLPVLDELLALNLKVQALNGVVWQVFAAADLETPLVLSAGDVLELNSLDPGPHFVKVQSLGGSRSVYSIAFSAANSFTVERASISVVHDFAKSQRVDLASPILQHKTSRRDVILGGLGNDVLQGGPGEDWIFGQDGNDVLSGGLDKQASDLLLGGAGDDVFQVLVDSLPLLDGTTTTYVPSVFDILNGGDGTDQVLYLGGDLDSSGQPVPDYVSVRFNPFLQRYEFIGVPYNEKTREFVREASTATASAQPYAQNYLFFRSSQVEQFVIDTRAGDDRVYAGPGTLFPGHPSEWGIASGDRQRGAPIVDLIIRGGPGNDRLFGGAGDDDIYGDAGVDVIFGGPGSDRLDGGNEATVEDIIAADTGFEPDDFELGGPDATQRNDSPDSASYIATSLLTSFGNGLNFDPGDSADWYFLEAPVSGLRFGSDDGAFLRRSMIDLQTPRNGDGTRDFDGRLLEQFTSRSGLDPLTLYTAQDLDPGRSIKPAIAQQVAGAPDYYLIKVTNFRRSFLAADRAFGNIDVTATFGVRLDSETFSFNVPPGTLQGGISGALTAQLEAQLRSILPASEVSKALEGVKWITVDGRLVLWVSPNYSPAPSMEFVVAQKINVKGERVEDTDGFAAARSQLGITLGVTNKEAAHYQIGFAPGKSITGVDPIGNQGGIEFASAGDEPWVSALGNVLMNGGSQGQDYDEFIGAVTTSGGAKIYQLFSNDSAYTQQTHSSSGNTRPIASLRIQSLSTPVFVSGNFDGNKVPDLAVAIDATVYVIRDLSTRMPTVASLPVPVIDVIDTAEIRFKTDATASVTLANIGPVESTESTTDLTDDLLVGSPSQNKVYILYGQSQWAKPLLLKAESFDGSFSLFNLPRPQDKVGAGEWYLYSDSSDILRNNSARFGVKGSINKLAGPERSTGTLESTPISLADVPPGMQVTLSFDYQLFAEKGAFVDVVRVELIRADAPSAPIVLARKDSGATQLHNSTNKEQWTRFSVDLRSSGLLDPNDSGQISIRLVFDTTDGLNNELPAGQLQGLFVDNVRLEKKWPLDLRPGGSGIAVISTPVGVVNFGRSVAALGRVDGDVIPDFGIISGGPGAPSTLHMISGRIPAPSGTIVLTALNLLSLIVPADVALVSAGNVLEGSQFGTNELLLSNKSQSSLVYYDVVTRTLKSHDLDVLMVPVGDVSGDGIADLVGTGVESMNVTEPELARKVRRVGYIYLGLKDPGTLAGFGSLKGIAKEAYPDLLVESGRPVLLGGGVPANPEGILFSIGNFTGSATGDLLVRDAGFNTVQLLAGVTVVRQTATPIAPVREEDLFRLSMAAPLSGTAAISGSIHLGDGPVHTLENAPAIDFESMQFQRLMSAGDFNGDSFEDFLAVGETQSLLLLGPITDKMARRWSQGDYLIEHKASGTTADVIGDKIFGRPAGKMGDINGDGIGDLVFAGRGSAPLVTVIFGQSSIATAFAAPRTYAVDFIPDEILALEWNQPDTQSGRRAEIAIRNRERVQVLGYDGVASSVLVNLGTLPVGTSDFYDVGDSNGDGRNDLMLVSGSTGYLLTGTTSTSLVLPEKIGLPAELREITSLGDLNKDGFGELAAVYRATDRTVDTIRIYWGSASGLGVTPFFEITGSPTRDFDSVLRVTSGNVSGNSARDIIVLQTISIAAGESVRSVIHIFDGANLNERSDLMLGQATKVIESSAITGAPDMLLASPDVSADGDRWSDIVTGIKSRGRLYFVFGEGNREFTVAPSAEPLANRSLGGAEFLLETGTGSPFLSSYYELADSSWFTFNLGGDGLPGNYLEVRPDFFDGFALAPTVFDSFGSSGGQVSSTRTGTPDSGYKVFVGGDEGSVAHFEFDLSQLLQEGLEGTLESISLDLPIEVLSDFPTGQAQLSSDLAAVRDDTLYFVAGSDLWRATNTVPLAGSSVKGATRNSTSRVLWGATPVTVLPSVNGRSVYVDAARRLFVVDSNAKLLIDTGAGLQDMFPSQSFDSPALLGVVRETLFFTSAISGQRVLWSWRSGATVAQRVSLSGGTAVQFTSFQSASVTLPPDQTASASGYVYFVAQSSTQPSLGLWQVDLSSGTPQLRMIHSGVIFSGPKSLVSASTAIGDRIFFLAGTTGQIWMTDPGSDKGQQVLSDNPYINAEQLVVAGGIVFFQAQRVPSGGNPETLKSLYRLTAASANRPIEPATYANSNPIYNILEKIAVKTGDTANPVDLYFTVQDSLRTSLYRMSQLSQSPKLSLVGDFDQVTDFRTIPAGSQGQSLVFLAGLRGVQTPGDVRSLWRVTAGTPALMANPGTPGWAGIQSMQSVNGTLYISGSPDQGSEIWVADPVARTAQMLRDRVEVTSLIASVFADESDNQATVEDAGSSNVYRFPEKSVLNAKGVISFDVTAAVKQLIESGRTRIAFGVAQKGFKVKAELNLRNPAKASPRLSFESSTSKVTAGIYDSRGVLLKQGVSVFDLRDLTAGTYYLKVARDAAATSPVARIQIEARLPALGQTWAQIQSDRDLIFSTDSPEVVNRKAGHSLDPRIYSSAFPDPGLRFLVAQALGVPTLGTGSDLRFARPLRASELGTLSSLDAGSPKIGQGSLTSLQGLEYAINLRTLNLANNVKLAENLVKPVGGAIDGSLDALRPGIRDSREWLRQLGLGRLQALALDFVPFGGTTGSLVWSTLGTVTALQYLSLDGTGLNSLSDGDDSTRSLANLRKLKFFSLDNFSSVRGGITSLALLSGADDLKWVSVRNHSIRDIGALAGLADLAYVDLSKNLIADALPLFGERIVDDEYDPADASFKSMGSGWRGNLDPAAGAWEQDYLMHSGTSGEGTAIWSTGAMAAGTYEIFVTYIADQANTSAAKYALYPVKDQKRGDVLKRFDPVNQRELGAQENPFGKQNWRSLGLFTLLDLTSLEIELSSSADGAVVADAIRIEKRSPSALKRVVFVGNPLNNTSLRGLVSIPVIADDPATGYVQEGIQRRTPTDPAPSWDWKSWNAALTYDGSWAPLQLPGSPGPVSVSSSDDRLQFSINASRQLVRKSVSPGFSGTVRVTLTLGATNPEIDGRTSELWFNVHARESAVYGTKFQDTNGNGIPDSGEPVPGWRIYNDANRDRILDENETSTLTDVNGDYVFVLPSDGGAGINLTAAGSVDFRYTGNGQVFSEDFDGKSFQFTVLTNPTNLSNAPNLWTVGAQSRGLDKLLNHSPGGSLYFGASGSPTAGGGYEQLQERVFGAVESQSIVVPQMGVNDRLLLDLNQLIDIAAPTSANRSRENIQIDIISGNQKQLLRRYAQPENLGVITGELMRTKESWRHDTYEIPASYSGKSIKLQFSFDSGDDFADGTFANPNEGWFIDDIRLTLVRKPVSSVVQGVNFTAPVTQTLPVPAREFNEGQSITIVPPGLVYPGASYAWILHDAAGTDISKSTTSINSQTGSVSFLPPNNGFYTAELTVKQGELTRFHDVLVLKVNDLPPRVSSAVASFTLKEWEPRVFSGPDFITDPNPNDRVVYNWTLYRINPGGQREQLMTETALQFSFESFALGADVPVGRPAGSYVLLLEATADGKTVSRELTITVQDRPLSAYVRAGFPVNFTTSSASYDFDAAQLIDPYYLAKLDQISWVLKGPSSGLGAGAKFGFQPNRVGVYTLTLSAREGSVDVSTSFSLTVLNSPPAVSLKVDGGKSTLSQGATAVVRVEGVTPGEHLISWQARADGGAEALIGTILDNGAEAQFQSLRTGSYLVGARVTDSKGNFSDLAPLRIVVVNATPQILGLTVTSGQTEVVPEHASQNYVVDEGSSLSLSAIASDAANDPLTYAWRIAPPSGSAVQGASGTLRYTVPDNGLYEVELRARDNLGAEAVRRFTIQVLNTAPASAVIRGNNPIVGQTATYSASFVENGSADLATVMFDWTLFDSLGKNLKEGKGLNFVLSNPQLSSYRLQMQITDKDGGKTSVVRDLVTNDGKPVFEVPSVSMEGTVRAPIVISGHLLNQGTATGPARIAFDALVPTQTTPLLVEADGSFAVSHAYGSSGVFQVVLSVPTNSGVVEKRLSISVANGILARQVFYNNSVYDGFDADAGLADDAAIATDKEALRPGQTASFKNYTSSPRGINGLMIDFADLSVLPTQLAQFVAANLEFQTGSGDGAWTVAPNPRTVVLRDNQGIAGGVRLELIWADGVIRNQWLKIRVKAGSATGLAVDDIFVFGNLAGETGDSLAAGAVTAFDKAGVAAQRQTGLDPTLVTNRYDFNRDGWVDALDYGIARDQAALGATLRLITISSVVGVGTQTLETPEVPILKDVGQTSDLPVRGEFRSARGGELSHLISLDLLSTSPLTMRVFWDAGARFLEQELPANPGNLARFTSSSQRLLEMSRSTKAPLW